MPELPEVETVRKGLEKLVVGKPFKKSLFFGQELLNHQKLMYFKVNYLVKRLKELSEEENF